MKTDIRTIRTKKALKNALLELLKSETFEKISVSELCDYAKINRVTFYTHFKDKYDLFHEILIEIRDTVIQAAIAEAKGHNNQERICNFFCGLTSSLIDECDSSREIISHMGHQENLMLVSMVEDVAIKNIREIINELSRIEDNSIPKQYIAEFLSGGFARMIFAWILDPHALPKDKFKSNIIDLIKELLLNKTFYE